MAKYLDASGVSTIWSAVKGRYDTSIAAKENSSNKVTSIGASSTDTQYPSAKCMYDVITDNEEVFSAAINALNTGKADVSTAGASLAVSGKSVSLKNAAGTVLSTISTQDTTYSAGTGISLSGTTFSNSGVRSITQSGQTLNVNTGGTTSTLDVAAPMLSKTYSSVTVAADNQNSGWIYFGKILPTSSTWQSPWRVRYKITITTSEANTQGYYMCELGAAGDVLVYKMFNNYYSSSYRPMYNHVALYPKNGYSVQGGYFGIRLQSSRTPTTLARNIKVEVYEAVGCTVSLLDSMSTYSSLYNSTYFYSTEINGTSQGLQETGDNDTINDYGYNLCTTVGPELNLPYLMLFGYDSEGSALALSNYTSGYSSYTTSISTSRVYASEVGFDWTRGMYIMGSSPCYTTDTSNYFTIYNHYCAFDLRYADNCVNSTATSTLGIERYKGPLYLRGIIKENGRWYPAPLTVTYNGTSYKRCWTQDIPTSVEYDSNGYQYVYWYLGVPYYDSSYQGGYRIDFGHHHGMYWYKHGQFEAYPTNQIIETSWSVLKANRDASALVPGQQYRITDYTCAVNTSLGYATSAGHQFDIIVTADDKNHLNENARAAHHVGDTYFASARLENWELKYYIDNNTTKYPWAAKYDTYISVEIDGVVCDCIRDTSGDGREEEFNIPAGYDYCWSGDYGWVFTSTETPSAGSVCYCEYDTSSTFTVSAFSPASEPGRGVIYYMKDEFDNECPYDFKNIQFYRKFSNKTNRWTTIAHSSVGSVAFYTFSNDAASSASSSTDYSLTGISSHNTIMPNLSATAENLQNNVLFGSCRGNVFKYGCTQNTIRNGSNNYLDEICVLNIIVGAGQELGRNCQNNYIASDQNKLGKGCRYNTIQSYSMKNIFGTDCKYNTLMSGCSYNILGSYNERNLFKRGSSSNVLGKNCCNNELGASNRYNVFGDYCGNNDTYDFYGILTEADMSKCTFRTGVCNVHVTESQSSSFQNYDFVSVVDSSTNRTYIEIGENEYYNFEINSISSSSINVNFEYWDTGGETVYVYNETFAYDSVSTGGIYSWTNANYNTIYTDSNSDASYRTRIGDYSDEYEDGGVEKLTITCTGGREYVTTVARRSNGTLAQYCEADLYN